MEGRFGFVVAAFCLGACSILVDAGGLSGGPSASTDQATNGSSGDSGVGTTDGATDTDDDASGVHPYVQAVFADEPSLYYRLEETSDDELVKDETGKHPATFRRGGVHGVAGVFPGSSALRLSGTGGIDAEDIFDFEGRAPFTLEAWYLPEGYDMQYRFLFHHNEGDGPRQNYGLYMHSNDGLGFERYIDNAGRSVNVQAPSVGTWHHIVAVYDGERLQLFIDAALVGSTADGRSAKDKRAPLQIAYGWSDGKGVLRGTVDELAIYEKALSQARIQAHFDAAR